MTAGLVLGKFLPPHAGHVYLIEVARRLCDDLTVVVGTLAAEPIAGDLRVAWMRTLFSTVRVVHLDDELPQHPDAHPDFWALWKAALDRVLPHPVDLVFTSDPYGEPLAAVLGARWIPIDPERTAVPISGTAIRADPLAHWQHLPPPVRAHLVRRISVFGPESTGKTTLAAELAAHLGTTWVPEYARGYLEATRCTAPTADDLRAISRGQAASEDALAPTAERVLLCDTDPLLTCVWSEALLGDAPAALRADADARRYHLTLLLDVDVPWQADPVRYRPDDRPGFFARCEAALIGAGRRYVTLRGDRAQRLASARAAIEEAR